MNIDFSNLNFAPFLILIVVGAILVFIIEKIVINIKSNSNTNYGGFGGGGGGKKAAENILEFVTDKTSNSAIRRERENAQRALIHNVKISGLVTGLALVVALVSLFIMLGFMSDESSENREGILAAAAGLIMGSAVAIAFAIRFFQFKREYELYYGSIFGKKQ